MKHGRWSLYSVIVSVMVSESRVFRCHELPEWQRPLWVTWSLLPGFVAGIGDVRRRLAVRLAIGLETISGDWQAGCSFVFGLLLPAPVAAG